MEFVNEFDLTNQQIVLLNEIDIASGHANSDIVDFINSPADVSHCEYEPFEDIQNPLNNLESSNTCSDQNDVQQQLPQIHVVKNRNGNRYLKFKKPKKALQVRPPDRQPKQCPIASCDEVFTSKLKLNKHIEGHAFQKKHRCDVCFEEFNVLENLTLHISLHSGDGRCPQCGKVFRRLASLEGHIKTHFKNEYYMCTQGCDEMFHLEWMLKQHISQFHPDENARIVEEKEEKKRTQRRKHWNCQYCGKHFTKNCLLIRHERVHNGQKPFKCDKCDRSFAQKNTLVIHQRRHSDQRMFQCTQCPQSFVQKGNLVSHVAKCHTYKEGELSFSCNRCSCVFKKIGSLNAHISKFHQVQNAFQQQDDLGFKVDDVMQQLNDLHRPGTLESELISKELFFNLPIPITEEVPIAENDVNGQSDYGNVDGNGQNSLKLAIHTSNGMVTHRNVIQRIHGNIRWYVCLYCPKEFRRPSDLVRHIRIHTKEKPFACNVPNCTKKFSVKSSLNAHLNTHLKTSQEQTCRVCLQTFLSAESFDEHCRVLHQDNPMFQCFICSQLCVTNGELKRHFKCHRSPVQMKQPIQEKENDDGIQLDIIMKEPIVLTQNGQIEITTEKNSADQERKFECTVQNCRSLFKRKGHLKEHMKSHLGVKSHKCEICLKSFGKMSILNRHLLYHSNEKKFKCGICSASFISNNQLKRHSLKHTNQRNVMCPYCHKRFKSKATCRIHLQIHKNEWVKKFKEQLKSGTIQLEEDIPHSATYNTILDFIAPPTSEAFNDTTSHLQNEIVSENGQVLVSNVIEPTQVDDSRNQFEYFLLLPTNNVGGEVRTEADQFVVNDEQLNFANLQFIQLDQSSLLEIQDSALMLNDQRNENPIEVQLSELGLQVDSNDYSTPKTGSEDTSANVVIVESNETPKKNPTSLRKRKSTKPINKCETCLKIFSKPVDLRRHIRTHTMEKPFSCSLCPKAFGLKSTLQNHIKHRHMSIKQTFPCTVCWKGFSSRHSMLTHMLIHSNSRPFQCEYCTTTFRTRGHLKSHQQIHLREATKLGLDPCDIKTKKEKTKLQPLLNAMKEFCDRSSVQQFVDNNEFNEELVETVRVDRSIMDAGNVHLSEGVKTIIYQCSVCALQFDDKDNFTNHSRTHKQDLRCTDCDKIFKKPSLLKRHMIVHFGSKEFTCQICQKAYTQKCSLQAHMMLHTDGGASFECSQCHKKFNFKNNLTTHEKKCNKYKNEDLKQ
ncbi:Zinc finger protein [Pseudolycoriella hygida]|uniref:Zinc finger protein n=1 Tax=Pseudolycoriella hygida TaxID=35572 RepID=A0A9Q0NFF6_9DIPT|nr:Zinc finger protein [Pseudolycoriella hygida]